MCADHIGKYIDLYIDDVLVKSVEADNYLDHLKEAFAIFQKYNMKQNPKKYSFRGGSGKFFDFLVSNRLRADKRH